MTLRAMHNHDLAAERAMHSMLTCRPDALIPPVKTTTMMMATRLRKAPSQAIEPASIVATIPSATMRKRLRGTRMAIRTAQRRQRASRTDQSHRQKTTTTTTTTRQRSTLVDAHGQILFPWAQIFLTVSPVAAATDRCAETSGDRAEFSARPTHR